MYLVANDTKRNRDGRYLVEHDMRTKLTTCRLELDIKVILSVRALSQISGEW